MGFDVGDTAVVVDSDMKIGVAHAAAAGAFGPGAAAVHGPASRRLGYFPDFVDVEMHQLTRRVAFMTPDHLTCRPVDPRQAVQPVALKYPPHRGHRHPRARPQIHRPAPSAAPQPTDPFLNPGWGSPRRPVRPRTAVHQPSLSVLAPKAPPLRDRAPRQTHLSRHMSLRHPRLNPLDHQQTPRGRTLH